MSGQHDERGEVFALAAESIADPRAHARKAGPVETGRLEQRALTVHAGLADEVVNERDLVHDGTQRSHDLAEHLAASAMSAERPDGFLPRTESVLKRLDVFAEITGLSIALDQLWFEVEQVNVAGRARHEEVHDALRLGSEVRNGECGMRSGFSSKQTFVTKQTRQRDPAQSAATAPKKLTAAQCRHMKRTFVEGRVGVNHIVPPSPQTRTHSGSRSPGTRWPGHAAARKP